MATLKLVLVNRSTQQFLFALIADEGEKLGILSMDTILIDPLCLEQTEDYVANEINYDAKKMDAVISGNGYNAYMAGPETVIKKFAYYKMVGNANPYSLEHKARAMKDIAQVVAVDWATWSVQVQAAIESVYDTKIKEFDLRVAYDQMKKILGLYNDLMEIINNKKG